MPASSALVNTAESAELRLIQVLGNHDPEKSSTTPSFVQSCETHIANADAYSLLSTIFANADAIKIMMEEENGSFALLVALLDRVNDESKVKELEKIMVQTVTSYSFVDSSSEEEEKQTNIAHLNTKISLLCNMFNLCPLPSTKTNVLVHILGLYKSQTDDLILDLLPSRKSSLSFLFSKDNLTRHLIMTNTNDDAANVDKKEYVLLSRTLYNVAADCMKQITTICKNAIDLDQEWKEANVIQQKMLLKLLNTYSSDDIDQQGIEAAQQAAVNAIRDPITLVNEQKSILSLPPIIHLKSMNNTNNPSLYQLLHIFQEGKLDDFTSFVAANNNKDLFTTHDLSIETCTYNMRILSFCTLATDNEEIPYASIMSTLELQSTNDVETWVINTVSSGLVSAKMDQLNQVVMVDKICVNRKFGMEQWQSLKEKIDGWKGNVKRVLEGLKSQQVGGSGKIVQQ
jgi:hypothetical protein